jgi:hypothetical protein
MCKSLFKGTEGKWIYRVTSSHNRIPSSITISQENTDPFTRRIFPDSRSIARLQPIFGDETFDRYHYGLDETIANAKLITNAPEMFKELVSILETYDKGTDIYKRIDSLIRNITD